tara:strand:- start:669 stop:830 length:162 start_codon:yes stop_codon:yes gene_type:complete
MRPRKYKHNVGDRIFWNDGAIGDTGIISGRDETLDGRLVYKIKGRVGIWIPEE